MCIDKLSHETLGQAWLSLLSKVVRDGDRIDDEIIELRDVYVAFSTASESDPLLLRHANLDHIAEMRKVFFTHEHNRFGHSYAEYMRGPQCRQDLSDVVELLRSQPSSKRALLTLVGDGAKVPCISAVHFLIRDDRIEATYFSRGQDLFNKFYADAICIQHMLARVSEDLGVACGGAAGFISSAHVYIRDLPAISDVLDWSEDEEADCMMGAVS